MRQGRHNKTQIASVNIFQLNMRVENPDISALADQMFDNRDDRAFTQVVRTFLEG